jgi:formylglycine-generating enzyme required for sulfatase activity
MKIAINRCSLSVFVKHLVSRFVAALVIGQSADAQIKAAAGQTGTALPLPKECKLDLGDGIALEAVLVQRGEFIMGDSIAKPVHKVTITKPFYMGKYVVTQEQYEKVMGCNPSYFKGPKRPVEQVSWYDAQDFCRTVSGKTGRTVRLPTEAEWEYACRAGTTTKFSFGDSDTVLGEYAWWAGNSRDFNAVGTKKPNPWGLYDMHGGVWEWCQDWLDAVYPPESAIDPVGPATGTIRVLRGGVGGGGPYDCRSANRDDDHPGHRYDGHVCGFRVVVAAAAPIVAVPSEKPLSVAHNDAAVNDKTKENAVYVSPVAAQTKAAVALSMPKESQLDVGDGVTLDVVLVPNGEFEMGGSDEKPVHTVTITKPFYMGKYEVTQEQYEKLMGNNPSFFKKEPKNPVDQPSWFDAETFCQKLSKKTGKTVRLPTEAEWEYACRAGTTTKYNFGDNETALGEYAWYHGNAGNTTHQVGKKKPNAWGLYDMHGNVWEWCQDWYDEYQAGSTSDPAGPANGGARVLRGGSWDEIEPDCRSVCRNPHYPDDRRNTRGFRVLVDVFAQGHK